MNNVEESVPYLFHLLFQRLSLPGIDRADDSGGIIIISGDRAQMGRILEVNTEASRILR